MHRFWNTHVTQHTSDVFAVLAYQSLFIGNMIGVVPDEIYFELDQGQNVGFYSNTTEFTLYSISSLLFFTPFWVHFLLNLIRENRAKIIHWAVLFTALTLCVLTGRRAVQILIFLSPIIVLTTEKIVGGGVIAAFRLLGGLFNWRNTAVLSVGAVVLLFTFVSLDFRLDALIEDFMRGFAFDDANNLDASARSYQYDSLTQAWLDGNLLFGAGNGSHTDYVRSDNMPWAYELTYIYLLFSTGIVGVLFYFWWFGWGLLRIRDALRLRPDMVMYVAPMISGVLGLAIAAASNPYFGKFDYLWIIMLPHLLAGGIKYQKKVAIG
jgi:hypothetical protein